MPASSSPYDFLAKNLMAFLLEPLGQVPLQHTIRSGSQFADVLFSPHQQLSAEGRERAQQLGVLLQFLDRPTLIEHFSSAPDQQALQGCLRKLLNFRAFQHQGTRRRKKNPSQPPVRPAQLLLLLATPAPALEQFGSREPGLEHPVRLPGVFTLPAGFHTYGIFLHQLPVLPETLWLRLLGRGETFQRAVLELSQLPPTHPLRTDVMDLLVEQRLMMLDDADDIPDKEDMLMYYSPVVEKFKRQLRDEGREEGREEGRLATLREMLQRTWQRRFGAVPSAIQEQLEATTRPELLESLFDVLADAPTAAEARAGLMTLLKLPSA